MTKLLAAALLAIPMFQQTPVFRSGVDLVTVDVVVLDKSGAPVTDLMAADFTVLAAKRPRRILSVEYVRAAEATPTPPRPEGRGVQAVPAPSSNARPAATVMGRTIIFAVDVEEIRAGQGRGVMKDIAAYAERLGPGDRIGIVSLPGGTPRLDPTTDRAVFRKVTEAVVGASRRYEWPEKCGMTPGEALAIVNNDDEGVKAYAERVPPGERQRCPPQFGGGSGLQTQAQHALNRYQQHTRAVLDALGAMANAMAPLPGLKSLVLVSEGILNNVDVTADLQDFARITERTRVSLYALHLDVPLAAAADGGGNPIRSRTFDDHLGMDGMAEVSHVARGTALRVVGDAAKALAQIDRELSGYYLLSFEREPTDKDGARVGIEVKVNRPGLDIRARREFTATPAVPANATPVAPKDPRTAMAELLQWPATVGDLRVDLDAIVQPVAGSASDARVLIVAEIVDGRRALAAVGYEFRDDRQRPVADSFDLPPTLRRIDDQRALYIVAQPLPPGQHWLKFGVIDADGRRGSIEHQVAVATWAAGQPRVSDLMIGDVSAGAFRPTARLDAGASQIGIRLEIHADTPNMFDGIDVEVAVAKPGGAAPFERKAVTPAGGAEARTRSATTILDILGYSSGQYVVTATVRAGGSEIATRRRLFTK